MRRSKVYVDKSALSRRFTFLKMWRLVSLPPEEIETKLVAPLATNKLLVLNRFLGVENATNMEDNYTDSARLQPAKNQGNPTCT